MRKLKKDRFRRTQFHNEAVVDVYRPEERALGRYYYLENQLRFPFGGQISLPGSFHRSVKVKLSRSSAWHRKMPPICSCWSAGKSGPWRCPVPTGRS
ncbi:MAG: calcium-binding protein [Candidatus Binataceae bacterium]